MLSFSGVAQAFLDHDVEWCFTDTFISSLRQKYTLFDEDVELLTEKLRNILDEHYEEEEELSKPLCDDKAILITTVVGGVCVVSVIVLLCIATFLQSAVCAIIAVRLVLLLLFWRAIHSWLTCSRVHYLLYAVLCCCRLFSASVFW